MDDTLLKIGKELMSWLQMIASQNEKYRNVVLIQNLEFLIESLSVRDDVTVLKRLSMQAIELKSEAERRYIEWMIAYEFSSYTQLADRVKELGKRATPEEMGLYIRRSIPYLCNASSLFLCSDEVSRAVSKMDKKTAESSVINLKKRLEKHFNGFTEVSVSSPSLISSSYLFQGLSIIPRLWTLIQGELSRVFALIENVATLSYQIALMVDEKTIQGLCALVPV